MRKGILYGVGVGPGDPELITIKAVKAIESSDVIAVPGSGGKEEAALKAAEAYVKEKPVLRLRMPMTRDKSLRDSYHAYAAGKLIEELEAGKTVAFLTLGDPTVYSTYMYLHERVVSKGCEAKIIPGVPSFCAAAAVAGQALCRDDGFLHIIPASYPESLEKLELKGGKVFMKAGRGLQKVREYLRGSGELERSVLVERCGMEGERIVRGSEGLDVSGGYFSIILVSGDKA